MAGEARTQSFVLSAATVMIGPATSLYDLNPSQNSIGLVKNFQCSATPTYIDLTQGVKGAIIASVMTNNAVKASMEVYEYTSQNLAYGLGLDGSTLTAVSGSYPIAAAVTGLTATPVTTVTFNNPVDVTAQFPIGEWIAIQDVLQDHVHYAKLTAIAAVSGSGSDMLHTLTFLNQGLKTGNDFPLGSLISPVNVVDVGSKDDQPYLAAKVTAILPTGNAPLTILYPKIRVTKGFSVTFSTDKFTDLPYEFQPYDVLPADPFYADFVGRGSARLFTGT